MEQLKEKMRATWMAGDFGKIAEYTANDAEAFVEALDCSFLEMFFGVVPF
jgi:hypothetical protein